MKGKMNAICTLISCLELIFAQRCSQTQRKTMLTGKSAECRVRSARDTKHAECAAELSNLLDLRLI